MKKPTNPNHIYKIVKKSKEMFIIVNFYESDDPTDSLSFKFNIVKEGNKYNFDQALVTHMVHNVEKDSWMTDYENVATVGHFELAQLKFESDDFDNLSDSEIKAKAIVEKFISGEYKLATKIDTAKLVFLRLNNNLSDVPTFIDYEYQIDFPHSFMKRYLIFYTINMSENEILVHDATVTSLRGLKPLFGDKNYKMFKTNDLKSVDAKMQEIVNQTIEELKLVEL